MNAMDRTNLKEKNAHRQQIFVWRLELHQNRQKYEGDKPLQYGTQYIVGGVFVDIHTSAKKKGTFTLDIRNHPTTPDFARQLQEYIDAASEPEDDSAI